MWTMLLGALAAPPTIADARATRDAEGAGTAAEREAARRAVVHEWGTFTSLHAPDGRAVSWRTTGETHALPSFVQGNLRHGDVAFAGPVDCDDPDAVHTKGSCFAQVRMETPVIYVHTDGPARFRLQVGFVDGFHTEWYPAARDHRTQAGLDVLDWGWVSAEPRSKARLPVEPAPSPYYAARDVDAALLRVDDQVERFLFYRGIGGFEPPVHPRATDASVSWDGRGAAALIVYERTPERTGAVVLRGAGEVARSALSSGDPRDALRTVLRAEGLYPDEVEAMLATWEADWFEPGLRAFYLMPRDQIDARLPLAIEPAPQQVVRVIVGRADLIRPSELALAAASSAQATVERHGRFGEAVVAMAAGEPAGPAQHVVR